MRALVVEQPGGLEAMRLRKLPTPQPGPGQVVVAVEAVGVNPVDAGNRANPSWQGYAPYVVGYELAGRIQATGGGDAGFRRRLAASPLPAGNEFEVVLTGGTLAAFTYLDSERVCHGGLYDLAAGTWRRISACPLLPIMYPKPIWTGSRIVLLTWGPEWFDGGEVNPQPERVYTNGIYDPVTDSWSRPSDRPGSLQPGYGGRFIWTGREVLLWGLSGGVVYDPGTDRWRRMAQAPFTREFASYVWTGTELLIWGGFTGQDCADGCPRADGLAYRPAPG